MGVDGSMYAGSRARVVLDQPGRLAAGRGGSTDMTSVPTVLVTERLRLRPWHVSDAPSALAIYGHAEVARWLGPDMGRVPGPVAMRLRLRAADLDRAAPPGHPPPLYA